jgi:RNA-directed DNA polymerase
VTFTFCGYAFRPRKTYDGGPQEVPHGILPPVALGKLNDMSQKVASWNPHRRTTWSLEQPCGAG